MKDGQKKCQMRVESEVEKKERDLRVRRYKETVAGEKMKVMGGHKRDEKQRREKKERRRTDNTDDKVM